MAFVEEDLQKTSAYLRALGRANIFVDVRYFAYKVQNTLSSTLHVEDFLTQSLVRSARRHHRQVLVQLVQFWQVSLSP